MKAHGGTEAWLHSLSTLPLEGGGVWSVSAPADTLLEKKTPATIEKKPRQIA
jgi:hypothetical protein